LPILLQATTVKAVAAKLARKTKHTAEVLEEKTEATAEALATVTEIKAEVLASQSKAEERIKMFVAAAIFVLLGAVYWFNATNGADSDIPTDLLVAGASLIVGYYFRGKP
jgi:uncharacterized membrane protein